MRSRRACVRSMSHVLVFAAMSQTIVSPMAVLYRDQFRSGFEPRVRCASLCSLVQSGLCSSSSGLCSSGSAMARRVGNSTSVHFASRGNTCHDCVAFRDTVDRAHSDCCSLVDRTAPVFLAKVLGIPHSCCTLLLQSVENTCLHYCVHSACGLCSAELGPKTPLSRPCSSCHAGCTKNQHRRPFLLPFRGRGETCNFRRGATSVRGNVRQGQRVCENCVTF